jgi:hypothetical protein
MYDASEELYKKSLAIVEKFYGKDHSFSMRVLHNMAQLYQLRV